MNAPSHEMALGHLVRIKVMLAMYIFILAYFTR